MPGLALRMNALFLGLHDFHLSSSDKDMSGNVWNRPSGSFMVDMGISSNIMKSPSPKCYMTIWDMVIYSDTLNWSNITLMFEPITELDLITNFDLITKFLEVSMIEHCNGCGQPTEDAYTSGHLVLSHLGLAFVLMLRPFFPNLSSYLRTFWISNILRYFYFASYNTQIREAHYTSADANGDNYWIGQ